MATWQKIDDATCAPEQPYSAFLAKSLVRNVNSYPTDLARRTVAAWPLENPVRWASYGQPTGTVLVCDCGLNAHRLTFRASYSTDTVTGGGRFVVRHIDSGAEVTRFVSGDTNYSTIDIEFPLSASLRGSHAFFFGWISDDDETLGLVAIKGAVANQVYLGRELNWIYPVPAGQSAEMHARLHFNTTPNVGELAPIADGRLDYQVCLFSHRQGNDPHAVFTIWPEIEQTPAFLPTFYDNGLQMTAALIGLGVLNLYGVAMIVTESIEGALTAPTAYSQTTPPTAVANNIGVALSRLTPSLCCNASSTGMLNTVLRARETLSFAFAVQNESEFSLSVTFKCYGFNGAANPAPDFTLTVYDALHNTEVFRPITLSKIPVARMQPQTTETESGAAAFNVNGIVASEGKWGLRDSMTITQTDRGTTVRFLTDAFYLYPIETYGRQSFYATIECTSDVYIYGFLARLV